MVGVSFIHKKTDTMTLQLKSKPVVTDNLVEQFLNGFDSEQFIRSVEAKSTSNQVAIHYLSKTNKEIKVDTYTPFLWFRELNSDIFFSHGSVRMRKNKFIAQFNAKNLVIDGLKAPLTFSGAELDNILWYDLDVNEGDDEDWVGVRFPFPKDKPEIRQQYIIHKMNEYSISFKNQMVSYDDNIPVNRMAEGFKILATIHGGEKKRVFSHPLLVGKKHNGTYKDLCTFFAEGGLNINGNKYLDVTKLTTLMRTAPIGVKLYVYFNFLRHSETKRLFNDLDWDAIIKVVNNNSTTKWSKSSLFKFLKNSCKQSVSWVQNTFKNEMHLWDVCLNPYNVAMLELRATTFDDSKFRDFMQEFTNEQIDLFKTVEQWGVKHSPVEQYLIQSGKRLFKSVENYNDMTIMSFDIETEAQFNKTDKKLYPKAALSSEDGRIFLIGCKTNDGRKLVLRSSNDEEELNAITKFFEFIVEVNPDVIVAHNGEGFDFPFIEGRLQRLIKNGLAQKPADVEDEEYDPCADAKTYIQNILANLYPDTKVSKHALYSRRASMYKAGGETKNYYQTSIWGISVLDTLVAVDRAKSVDKSIQNLKLKWNIVHAGLGKKNRVYVDGEKIGFMARTKTMFALNTTNGAYNAVKNVMSIKQGFPQIDTTASIGDTNALYITCSNTIPSQLASNSFVFTPASTEDDLQQQFNSLYEKAVTFKSFYFEYKDYKSMYSDINGAAAMFSNLATILKIGNTDISNYEIVTGMEIVERYLVDDLDETLALAEHYSQATFEVSKWLPTILQRSATMGTAAVWKLLLGAWSFHCGIAIPKPEAKRKIVGGLQGMVSSGFHRRGVKLDFSSLYPSEFIDYVDDPAVDITQVMKPILRYALNTRLKYKNMKNEAKKRGDKVMELRFDKKQLPLKILINSFYGMLGDKSCAWNDYAAANEVTGLGRQHARHVIRWFAKFNFTPIYFHTDGVNFVLPDGVEKFVYVGKGLNHTVIKDKTYTGVEAYTALYNDTYFRGVMALAVDEFFESCINFSKANFCYTKMGKDGKLKISHVGGVLTKNDQLPYIDNFLDEALPVLMGGDASTFLQIYKKHFDRILHREITKREICKRVYLKRNLREYRQHTKSVQVHMEILDRHKLDINVGDAMWYYNNAQVDSLKDLDSNYELFCTLKLKDTDIVEQLLSNYRTKDDVERLIRAYDYENRVHFPVDSFNLFSMVSDNTIEDMFKKYKAADGVKMAISTEIQQSSKRKNKKMGAAQLAKSKQVNTKFMGIKIVNRKLNCIAVKEVDLDTPATDLNTFKYIDALNKKMAALAICFPSQVRETILLTKKTPHLMVNSLELINGVPLKGKEDKQLSLGDCLKVGDDELENWLIVGKSPNFGLDGVRLTDKTAKYTIFENNTVEISQQGEYTYEQAIRKLATMPTA